ncbi:MAG: neutral zinc metallopeptidase [Campylobacterales bacterium]|nr:neutral zinc metallopeptidase [Campylobacterales bacterium]
MRWQGRNESSNVDDRRGLDGSSMSGGNNALGAVFFFWPLIKMLLRTKFGWAIIAIGVVAHLAGFSPLALLDGTTTKTVVNEAQDDEQKRFIATVLRDTELVWDEVLGQYNRSYPHPKLVLYRGSTHSGCGQADAQIGPFYCPADEKIYIDLSFFDELKSRFNAAGDFAQAYVLAHEVGHHIQHILGILDIAHKRKSNLYSKTDKNAVQVQVELQADCLAGVWAYHANRRFNILEEGDIEEAINAASAIGDDTLQKRSQGYVVPDAFTHGSSAQRVAWFKRGFESGNINICKTL